MAGFYGNQSGVPVTGISVRAEQSKQERHLHALANGTLQLAGGTRDVPADALRVIDRFVGPGYSLPTPEMTAAIQTFARMEGILLDPVYTGKAAAGLIGLIREGAFTAEHTCLFTPEDRRRSTPTLRPSSAPKMPSPVPVSPLVGILGGMAGSDR